MSIQRYKFNGPQDIQLPRFVGVAATMQASGIGYIDINLSDDAFKADLDDYMASLGCAYVETTPTTPVTTTPGVVYLPPIADAIVGGLVNVDVQAGNTHVLSELVANTALTFLNGIDGCEGTIAVRQNGVGGFTLSFAAAGRTVLKDVGVADLQPADGIDAVTMYAYSFFTVDAVAYVMIAKTELDAAP